MTEEKNKQNKKKEAQPSFFKEMKSFIKPYSPKFALSVVISLISVFSNLLSYLFIGYVISFVFTESVSIDRYILFASLAVGA